MPGWVDIVVAIGIAISPMLPAPVLLALAGVSAAILVLAYRRRGAQ
jgi:hypothetical protein